MLSCVGICASKSFVTASVCCSSSPRNWYSSAFSSSDSILRSARTRFSFSNCNRSCSRWFSRSVRSWDRCAALLPGDEKLAVPLPSAMLFFDRCRSSCRSSKISVKSRCSCQHSTANLRTCSCGRSYKPCARSLQAGSPPLVSLAVRNTVATASGSCLPPPPVHQLWRSLLLYALFVVLNHCSSVSTVLAFAINLLWPICLTNNRCQLELLRC